MQPGSSSACRTYSRRHGAQRGLGLIPHAGLVPHCIGCAADASARPADVEDPDRGRWNLGRAAPLGGRRHFDAVDRARRADLRRPRAELLADGALRALRGAGRAVQRRLPGVRGHPALARRPDRRLRPAEGAAGRRHVADRDPRVPLGARARLARLGARRGGARARAAEPAYSGLIMTEVAFYPVFVLAAWALARAVEVPTLRRQAIALAGIVLVCATRLQAILFLPAYVTAAL